MGCVYCKELLPCDLENNIEVVAEKSITVYNINHNTKKYEYAPKEFFENLPISKVILLPKSNCKKNVESIKPCSIYDLPKNFSIPSKLCIEHEQGTILVMYFLK